MKKRMCKELIIRGIGRTKSAAFVQRWTEQRIFAVTGLYIQESRETTAWSYGIRSSEQRRSRLIGSRDYVDQTLRKTWKYNASVIEEASVLRCTGLVSCRGASTRGPVLFPAQR